MQNLKINKYKIIACAAVFVLIATFICTLCVSSVLETKIANGAVDFKTVGKSGFLVDVATGTVLYSRNEKERLPIASMVKIMTALLTLDEVDSGRLSLDDDVRVSENAASMGGSQVFLDANTSHKAGDLLKTVIVASANDSCVALAEHIDGSVEGFVARMNAKAKQLGMTDTVFKNCTGLPAAESFSSARDVSIMFRELIKHPTFFEYAHVWLEDYKHPDGRTTTITNTNKLVRFYEGCDGGKTGFTSEAKFCLCATAKKNGMRVVAVVIGADSSKVRNAAVSSMFDYAFANFSNKTMLKAGEDIGLRVALSGGKQPDIGVCADRDLTRFVSKDDTAKYDVKFDLSSSVKAPVKKGDAVGKAYLVKNGEVVDTAMLVASEDAGRISFFDAINEIAKEWNTAK